MTSVEVDTLVAVATRKMRRASFAEAAAVLTAALEQDPSCDQGWLLLGEVHRREGRPSAAIACYARGLLATPNRVELRVGLANSYAEDNRVSEAAEVWSQLAEDYPGNTDILFGSAMALHRAGRALDALMLLDTAIALDPDAMQMRFTRATMLLTLGRYAEGWRDYDARCAANPRFRLPDLPLWDGTPTPGKRLLVVAEGGYGDMILAARFLPAVRRKVASVHIELPPALQSMMAEIEGVDGLCSIGAGGDYDLCCPILSLPARLGITDPAAVPPARLSPAAPGNRLSALMARAGDKFRLGILWSGSETYADNRHRAAPLEVFLPLIERADVQVFSLQKGPQQAVLRDAGLGDLVIDTDDFDFSETAALLQALDLVIMTDTAVAHIAGSLGTPVWVLLDSTPFWFFGPAGDQMPWYPSMALFRQKRPGDWAEPMAAVLDALDALLASRHTKRR